MATVRKIEDGCIFVTGGPLNTSPFCNGTTLSFTPEDALALARELRDAADQWSEEACIEWLKERCVCGPVWDKGRLRCCTLDGVFYHSDGWPSSLVFLRDRVHVLADVLGIPCPLGDLCKVCHPPVPTDDELARMGTEELIRWIEESGMRMHNSRFSVHRNGFNMSAWSVLTAAGRCEGIHASSTLLGLAQAVAAKLREANEDA
jgi:hypothetical protein